MNKKIVIDINNVGEIKAETYYMKGSSCLTELDKMLKDFSLEIETKKKPDFYDEKNALNKQIKQKY